MLKELTAISLFAFALSGLACGNSPIMHHETASDGVVPTDRSVAPPATTADCPVALPKSGLCASFTWDSAVTSEDENSATIRFWDNATGSSAGPYRNVAGDVSVFLWMPSMGHGSSPVIVTPQGEGIYAASRVYFIMPGEWEVRLQIKKNNTLFEQASFNIKL